LTKTPEKGGEEGRGEKANFLCPGQLRGVLKITENLSPLKGECAGQEKKREKKAEDKRMNHSLLMDRREIKHGAIEKSLII